MKNNKLELIQIANEMVETGTFQTTTRNILCTLAHMISNEKFVTPPSYDEVKKYISITEDTYSRNVCKLVKHGFLLFNSRESKIKLNNDINKITRVKKFLTNSNSNKFNFNWDEFKEGKFGVECYYSDDAISFLMECIDREIYTWHNGKKINIGMVILIVQNNYRSTSAGRATNFRIINDNNRHLYTGDGKVKDNSNGLAIARSYRSKLPVIKLTGKDIMNMK